MITAKYETISGARGPFKALVLSGDTRPLAANFKAMGFRWYAAKLCWWISSSYVTPMLLTKLKVLGIEVGENASTSAAPTAPTVPLTPEEHQKQTLEGKQPTKEWVSEEPDMTKWYGFPVNKNIKSYQETTSVDGKDYAVDITIDRSYVMGGDTYHKTKSREFKGKPKYIIHLTLPDVKSIDDPTQPYKKRYTFVSKQLWGTYDESSFLDTTLKDMVKNILTKPDKIPGMIKYKNELDKRTPEYKQFLNDIGQRKIAPTFDVHIDDPKYGGDFTVKVDSLAADEKCMYVYLDTHVEKEGAPSAATVSHQTPIEGTYTVEDFNRKIQNFISGEGHAKVQEAYIKYLKSFPYLDEQQTEAAQSVEEIKGILNNPKASANKVFDELKVRGYIRPHKRQRQQGGLTSGDEITWIIDSKKIVNDAYSYGSYLSHTPDYFYAVVAYYIHRQHKNIYSWTDMMLTDSMNIWRRSMEKYGIKLDLEEIDHIVRSIGSEIYNMFKGKAEPNKEEPQEDIAGALKEFADLAQKYGISIAGLESNVKTIYRALTKALHPDLVQDPQEKAQKTEEFKQLQNIYEAIPEQYKTACSWYDRYVQSESARIILTSSIKQDHENL